jgi:hypothetical protein
LCLIFLGGGCADAVLSDVKPVAVTPTQVSIVIQDKTTDGMAPEELRGLKDMIAASLQRQDIKVVSADNKAAPSLIGSIGVYNPGHHALQVWVEPSAGAGSIESSWELTDEQGATLGNCVIKGSTGWGLFSSDFDVVVQKVGERLAEFLKGEKG